MVDELARILCKNCDVGSSSSINCVAEVKPCSGAIKQAQGIIDAGYRKVDGSFISVKALKCAINDKKALEKLLKEYEI